MYDFDTGTLISLLLVVFLFGGLLGGLIAFVIGFRRGVDSESLRVDRVFLATTDVVYGGSIQNVWDCIHKHISTEEMKRRLKASQERKEVLKKALMESQSE